MIDKQSISDSLRQDPVAKKPRVVLEDDQIDIQEIAIELMAFSSRVQSLSQGIYHISSRDSLYENDLTEISRRISLLYRALYRVRGKSSRFKRFLVKISRKLRST